MKNRAARLLNAGYGALQGTYWMTYCIAVSFASFFLLGKGYSNTAVGAILAGGFILGLVLQPLIARIADRSGRISPAGVICLVACATGLSLVALLLLPQKSAGLSLAFVLFLGLDLALQPLVNAFAFYLERTGTPILFGMARGVGSLVYALYSMLIGWVAIRMPLWILPLGGIFPMLLLLATMAFLARRVPNNPSATTRGKPRSFAGLLRNRSFVFLLLGIMLLFTGHSFINNFLMQIITDLGGTGANLGALCCYCAMLELPAMWLYDSLRRKIADVSMLKVSAVFFTVKILLFFLAKSVAGLYLAQFFQAFSFALFIPASIRYADAILDPADSNSGQSLLTAMITVGSILSSLAGGVMIDRLGTGLSILIMAFFTVCGTATILFGMKKPAKVL